MCLLYIYYIIYYANYNFEEIEKKCCCLKKIEPFRSHRYNKIPRIVSLNSVPHIY